MGAVWKMLSEQMKDPSNDKCDGYIHRMLLLDFAPNLRPPWLAASGWLSVRTGRMTYLVALLIVGFVLDYGIRAAWHHCVTNG